MSILALAKRTSIGRYEPMSERHDATAIVVAGGRSARLGTDKRWIDLDGEALIHRSVRLMRTIFRDVVVSSNDPIPGLPSGVEVIPDETPGLGPISGIDACLRRTGADVVFAAACDAPFPSRALIGAMHPLVPTASAVVPQTARGLEPLFAFYGRDCLGAFRELLDGGDSQLIRVFDHVPTRRFTADELAGIPGAELSFLNINEPADLARARRVALRGWTF
jgi:molybdopterin-guanine dinucleotide biosynthesis protein A